MKEMIERLKDILGEKYFIFGECMIDSLVRIYEGEEVYNCEGCILTDTVSIKREYMLGKGMYPLCPLEMKTDIRVLK